MRIQIRKKKAFGFAKTDANGKIDDIIVHEDFMHPDGRYVALYFKGENASGIVKLGHKEANELMMSLQSQLKLVKKSKILRG